MQVVKDPHKMIGGLKYKCSEHMKGYFVDWDLNEGQMFWLIKDIQFGGELERGLKRGRTCPHLPGTKEIISIQRTQREERAKGKWVCGGRR